MVACRGRPSQYSTSEKFHMSLPADQLKCAGEGGVCMMCMGARVPDRRMSDDLLPSPSHFSRSVVPHVMTLLCRPTLAVPSLPSVTVNHGRHPNPSPNPEPNLNLNPNPDLILILIITITITENPKSSSLVLTLTHPPLIKYHQA